MATVLRFSELTPESYSELSRDFQLICALFDSVLNGCKYTVDSMKYLNVPELCPNQYLKYLSHKLGFEYDSVIYDDELRKILYTFKGLVRYKGSKKGINEAVRLFMNIKHTYFNYRISIDNNEGKIYILIKDQVVSGLEMLTDILKYILPCGYLFEYASVKEFDAETDYTEENTADIVIINNPNNSIKVLANGEDFDDNNATLATIDERYRPIVNGFNTMQVVSQDEITQNQNAVIVTSTNEGE